MIDGWRARQNGEAAFRFGPVIWGALILAALALSGALAGIGWWLVSPFSLSLPRGSLPFLILGGLGLGLLAVVAGGLAARLAGAPSRVIGMGYGIGAWALALAIGSFTGLLFAFPLLTSLSGLAATSLIGVGTVAAEPTVFDRLIETSPVVLTDLSVLKGKVRSDIHFRKPRPVSIVSIGHRMTEQVTEAVHDPRLLRPLRPLVARGRRLAGTLLWLAALAAFLSGIGSLIGGAIGGAGPPISRRAGALDGADERSPETPHAPRATR